MILTGSGTAPPPPPPPSGYYKVIAKHSGKCLDVAGVSTADGAKVQQWSCTGGNNQRWKLVSMGDGYNELVAAHSGKCLDVDGVVHCRRRERATVELHRRQQPALEARIDGRRLQRARRQAQRQVPRRRRLVHCRRRERATVGLPRRQQPAVDACRHRLNRRFRRTMGFLELS